jgi:hypothetical protein
MAHFVTPPQNVTVACGAIPSVPTVMYTNDGSGGCVNQWSGNSGTYSSAPACGGTLTDTWTFIDACQRTISGSRTITVTPAPIAHFVTPPGNITVACGGAGSAPVVSYTNEGSGDCAISGQVTAVRTGSAPICVVH